MHFQRTIQLAVVTFVAIVNVTCGRPAPKTFDVMEGRQPTLMDYTGQRAQTAPSPIRAATRAIQKRRAEEQFVLDTIRWMAAAPRPQPPASASVAAIPAPTVNVGDTAPVRACIKSYESGNYAESSHPESGSGAYQWIPSSWAEWSVRAGYGTRDEKGRPLPTYAYAYQAPPGVQDAVTDYAITNGGAGNWSPKFGVDPCTVGIGG